MNLFIGNLNTTISEQELSSLFFPFGIIQSLKIITGVQSRESKGLAFVKMTIRQDAINACKSLNGNWQQDRQIMVREA